MTSSGATQHADPVDGLDPWRRFHPLTPLLRGGVVFVGVLGYLVSQQVNRIFGADPEDPTRGHWGLAAGVLALVLLLVIGGSAVAWRASSFRLGRTTIELRHGVIAKQHRQVRYDRIQAVDIRRPLLARIFGLSSVRVEAAGGAGSNIELAFLPAARAEDLRAELVHRAAGAVRSEPSAPGEVPTGDLGDGGAQPGHAVQGAGSLSLIAAIPAARVWLATAMSFNTALLAVTVPLLLGALLTGTFGAVPVLGPMVLGALGQQFGRLSSWMNFRVETGAGVIRVRHGLTELRTSTIPLHRVQAVEVSQPALWRGLQWWRIRVNVAGVHSEAGEGDQPLIPVGTREEVLAILAALGPRWSLPEVIEGLEAPGPSPNFVSVPRAARWLDPLSWQRGGYAVTPELLICRGGWLGRSVQLVPHARVQSLTLEQGPLERRLGLANVLVHSSVGAVTPAIRHLDVQVATALIDQEAQRSRIARAAEGDTHGTGSEPVLPESAPDAISSHAGGPAIEGPGSVIRME
ncbi:MAG: PH domain-containing protein [Nostocoides sp.]